MYIEHSKCLVLACCKLLVTFTPEIIWRVTYCTVQYYDDSGKILHKTHRTGTGSLHPCVGFMAFVSHTVAVMVMITCFSLIFLSTKYIPVSPLAEDCSTPNQVSLLFLKTVDEDVVVSPQPVDC